MNPRYLIGFAVSDWRLRPVKVIPCRIIRRSMCGRKKATDPLCLHFTVVKTDGSHGVLECVACIPA